MEPTIEIGVFSRGETLPDLEESLTRVFGAGTKEYRFQQVFCIRLLDLLGAKVCFQRVTPCHSRIMVRFPATAAVSADLAVGGAPRGMKEKHMKRAAVVVSSFAVASLLVLTGCTASTKLRGSCSSWFQT